MATKDPGWIDRPPSVPWWRRRWTKGEKVWVLILLALVLALLWEGVKIDEMKAVVTGASAPAAPASAIQPAAASAAASAPATAASGKVVATATTATASQPKASASKPATAKKQEKKEAKQAAGTTPVATSPKIAAASAAIEKAATAAAVQKEPIFEWDQPGLSPCKANPNCTFAWAISQQIGWTSTVRQGMTNTVHTTQPDYVRIRKGDHFDSMAFGRTNHRMVQNVVVAWKDSRHTEPAKVWRYTEGKVLYEYFLPNVCGNHAFRTTRIEERPQAAPPIPAPGPDYSFLGIIPQVDC